jgi:dTDP-4-amino-4,6-dideoxygalactose transaminase
MMGAHAFGVKGKGKSIFEYWRHQHMQLSCDELFHTVEGGAVITKIPISLRRMAYLRNFGHDGPERIRRLGINGKNSELHAAMGLVNLSM